MMLDVVEGCPVNACETPAFTAPYCWRSPAAMACHGQRTRVNQSGNDGFFHHQLAADGGCSNLHHQAVEQNTCAQVQC